MTDLFSVNLVLLPSMELYLSPKIYFKIIIRSVYTNEQTTADALHPKFKIKVKTEWHSTSDFNDFITAISLRNFYVQCIAILKSVNYLSSIRLPYLKVRTKTTL